MDSKNNKFSIIQTKNWREKLCNVIFIKDFNNQKNPLFVCALIYNILIQSISLLGFVPMFYSFFDGNYNEDNQLSIFYFILLMVIIVYLIDYFLRLLVIDLHYNQHKFKNAFKKQLLSFCSNYQLLSFIIIYSLVIRYGYYEQGGIYFNDPAFSNDIAMIVFSIIMLFNLSSIFPRFIFSTIDIKNYEITKKIVYSRRKSIFFSMIAMFFFWLLFSFIVFKLEQNYFNSIPTDQIPSDGIQSIGNAMYFTFIAMTTVGFGDFVPHAPETKVVVVILAVFGVCFYAYVGSIFVNIYVEYINRKKTIRTALFNNKWNEIQNKQLLTSINKIMIDNLYKANLIDQQKYQELIDGADTERNEVVHNNEFDIKDISIENNKLLLRNKTIGHRVFDSKKIQEAQNDQKIAIFNNSSNIKINNMLYFLPSVVIKKIYHTRSLPVIFAKANDDFKNIKKLIFFQKKPIAEAVFQVNLAGSLQIDKEVAWNTFGKFSLFKKGEFHEVFKKQEKISVLLIDEFLFFDQKISLERYAINTNWKINNIIYLI